jgi:hypothetical protein
MNRSSFVRFKSLSLFLACFALASLAACGEDLESGHSCPLLCPQETAPLRDTLVDAIVLDTSAAGFPTIGFEPILTVAQRGDSLDTRVALRYDSLPRTYDYLGTDSAIVRVDSAYLVAPRPVDDSAVAFAANGTIEAYDITDAANDTAVASLAAQMIPANKLGEFAYSAGQSPDTLIILLDTARVHSRIANTRNLRVGLRMVSASSDRVRFTTVNSGGGISLTVVPNSDTSAKRIVFRPQSFTPPDPEYIRPAFADFQFTVAGDQPPANTLRVGGTPARRVLMKFDIPTHIIDSSVVVRATLLLTQRPSGSPDAGEAVSLHVVPILASTQVTDLHAQLEFAGSINFDPDSLVTIPKDSGVVGLEMVSILRAWRLQDTVKTPRTAAIIISSENTRLAGVDFFSLDAAPGLRPRLRITYVTRVNTGQP